MTTNTNSRITGAPGGDDSLGMITWNSEWTPGTVLSGDKRATQFDVPGVTFGDAVCCVSFSLDLADTTLSGYVSAIDTVTVIHANETGLDCILPSGTIHMWINKAVED